MTGPSVVTLLGFGEAGGTIGHGLAEGWRDGGVRRLSAIDIASRLGPHGTSAAGIASADGVKPSLDEALEILSEQVVKKRPANDQTVTERPSR